MENQLVGIIGLEGGIGKIAYENLKYFYRIKGGQRKFKKQYSEILQECVDINDERQLIKFVNGCDIILNCAGPSYLLSSNIIKITNAMKIPYVDVFGKHPYKKLKNRQSNTAILSAGCYPGFTGIFPVSIKNEFDKIDKITEIVGGRELGSINACQDIILSSLNSFGKGNLYLENSQMKHEDYEYRSKKHIAGFPENISLKAYFTKEFQKMADYLKVDNAKFYNAIVDIELEKKFFDACTTLSIDYNYNILCMLSKEICELQAHLVKEKGSWYGIKLELFGERKGIYSNKSIYVQISDSEILSGIVASEAVKCILNGFNEPGVFYPFEVMDDVNIIDRLIKERVININYLSDTFGEEEVGII